MIDPPVVPMDGSVLWFEGGPEPILSDTAVSTVIVRVSMATNALVANAHAGIRAALHPESTEAERTRDLLGSFVVNCSLVNEAVDLARENFQALKELALQAGASQDLIATIGKIGGGKHPADAVLRRARNKLGFHWDKNITRESVREYARNERLVWAEVGPPDEDGNYPAPVLRMGIEVLAHALFPDVSNEPDQAKYRAVLEQSMNDVNDVARKTQEFFVAAIYGFFRRHAIVRKTK